MLFTFLTQCSYLHTLRESVSPVRGIFLKTTVIKGETANKESLQENSFAAFNLHTGSATGGEVAVFIVLALAFGRFLLVKHLAKRKLTRARRMVPMGATTMQ